MVELHDQLRAVDLASTRPGPQLLGMGIVFQHHVSRFPEGTTIHHDVARDEQSGAACSPLAIESDELVGGGAVGPGKPGARSPSVRVVPVNAPVLGGSETTITEMQWNDRRREIRERLNGYLVNHSEYMGIYPMIEEKLPAVLESEAGARWARLIDEGKRSQVGFEFAMGLPDGMDLIGDPAFGRVMWDRVIDPDPRLRRHARRHDWPILDWGRATVGAAPSVG